MTRAARALACAVFVVLVGCGASRPPGAGPGRQGVMDAMRAVTPDVHACMRQGGAHLVQVDVVVASAGNVQSVVVYADRITVADVVFSACVSTAIRRAPFSPFESPPTFTYDYPFRL